MMQSVQKWVLRKINTGKRIKLNKNNNEKNAKKNTDNYMLIGSKPAIVPIL